MRRLGSFHTSYWAKKRQDIAAAKAKGRVIIADVGRRRVLVVCPFNEDFAKGMQKLGATWRHRTSRWSISYQLKADVIELAHDIYGEENVTVN